MWVPCASATDASTYISCEANEIILQGTTATVLGIELALPAGNMFVFWSGNNLHIDGKYSIANDRLSYWNRSSSNIRDFRTITVTAGGEDSLPVTLWHANRFYIVRFEEHFSAIIMPREVFYPLKLSLMREFVESFIPNLRSTSPVPSYESSNERAASEWSPGPSSESSSWSHTPNTSRSTNE